MTTGYIPHYTRRWELLGADEQWVRRAWVGLAALIPKNQLTASFSYICWYEVDRGGRVVGLITIG